MPRYEPLSGDDLEALDRGWERLVSEVGVRFDHPEARRLMARGAAGRR